MYKKDAIKKARELNPDYNYLTDNQVLDAIQKAIPDIKLEDEPFGYSVTKPIDDLGVDIAKGADNFIGDASSTVIGVGKKFGVFENINPEDLTTPGEILELRDDKYKFGESGILGRTAKRGADFVERGNESAQAYNEGKQGFGETAFQIGGKGVGEVSETIGDAFMSGLKTVAPTETEDYVKQITSDFINENEYAQGAMQMLQEYEKRKKWLKENSPEDYRNLEASVGAISGLVDMLGFGAGKKAVEGVTSAQIKEMTKQLTTKLNEGLKTSGEMIKNIKGTVVNGVKRTGKTIENLGDNGELFPAITDSGIKFEIAKPNIAYRINDKLFGDNLGDLASQAVKPRINVKKGYKGMLRNQDDILKSIYSLYDDFADGIISSDIQTMKGGVEGLQEYMDFWGSEIGRLAEAQVNKIDITEDIIKALDKIDADGLNQIDDLYVKTSGVLNAFAKQGGEISIKRLQEKLSSIKGDIFSNAETVAKLTSTDSGRALGDFLDNLTKKLDDAVSEIDGDGVWKKAKSKYALGKKLEQDFIKSFMVNNRNSKNGLSGVAGNMAGIAQILSDQSVKGAVKSLALKFAGDIIGYNKTRAGAWEKLIRKLHLKSIENAKKAKNTNPITDINSSVAKSGGNSTDNILSKGDIIKNLEKDVEKVAKTKSDADILTLSEKLADTLGVGKEKLLTIANTVKEYIKKYGAELKDKLGELIDDLADKLGIRSKFIDDTKTIYRGQSGDKLSYNKGNIPRNVDGAIYFTYDKELANKFGDNLLENKIESNQILSTQERKHLQDFASRQVERDIKNQRETDDLIEKMAIGQPKAFAEYTGKPYLEAEGDWGGKGEILYYKDLDKMSSKTLDNGGQKNIMGSDFKTNTEPMKNIIKATPENFKENIKNNTRSKMLSDLSISDLRKIDLYTNNNGTAGFGLKKTDSGIEIVNLYNNSGIKGEGKRLIKEAIKIAKKNNKDVYLDHFDGFLSKYYDDLGFKEIKREHYNPKYDEDGSFAKEFGKVDVVYRKLMEPKKDAGKQNVEFFTEKSAKASSDIPYEIQKDLIKDVPEKIVKDFDKYTMGGNFTGHIAKMIPTFAEKQLKVTNAISKNAKSFLDIGASEGGVVKTVADNGVKKAVALDPNRQMFENFKKTPEVKNAEYELKAFGAEWVEDDGFKVLEYKPKEKFDAINEDFAFQFMHPDRDAQVKLAKSMLNDDGVFITQEKFNPEGPDDKVWLANEAKKYDHQRKYFNEDQLTEDKQTIVSGMADDMVSKSQYEKVLKDNFKYVEQFWDAGNFKGFIASDSKKTIDKYLKDIGEITSEFDTRIPKKKLDNFKDNISKELIKEAKKYKSADEFIKGLEKKGDIAFHGAQSKFDEFDDLKIDKNNGMEYGVGHYFSKNKEYAKKYGTITKNYIYLKKPFILKEGESLTQVERLGITSKDYKNMKGQDKYKQREYLTNIIKRNGYDGVILEGKYNEIVVFDPKNIKTEAQLKKIYKQAHK